MLSLTTWPLSLQVILLLSDRSQFYHPLFDWIDDFLNEPTQSKWQKGSLFVIFYNGIYIYRYTFSILQYTFIGWDCGGPAAHLYQVYVWDTPPGSKQLVESFFYLNNQQKSKISSTCLCLEHMSQSRSLCVHFMWLSLQLLVISFFFVFFFI